MHDSAGLPCFVADLDMGGLISLCRWTWEDLTQKSTSEPLADLSADFRGTRLDVPFLSFQPERVTPKTS